MTRKPFDQIAAFRQAERFQEALRKIARQQSPASNTGPKRKAKDS
jgi:hypothetical protein